MQLWERCTYTHTALYTDIETVGGMIPLDHPRQGRLHGSPAEMISHSQDFSCLLAVAAGVSTAAYL